ncbi:Mannan polymerase II complex ANP1 subunit [Wickerhamomyces ciferrii]|uniref:Mannan polymerase II complex ANP1 subunit n=1 Tax=Wickerhamomyces ciferrii (strain ATCC 14091 / BCRC 22168 / CBS 111 / JCM 3599 / NBRC 0793 / NRRL Y-1031 F-60-10) TaxID=1206466 RepID=K0KGY6_WICCF|nr:Mannan polymerase II complex ANP1 subunit [Wickerhamomyces ciferrii]CCH42241.1 Mannan polymerase II complex ANP1 subunit [Wickerhamomyces ciferrii]
MSRLRTSTPSNDEKHQYDEDSTVYDHEQQLHHDEDDIDSKYNHNKSELTIISNFITNIFQNSNITDSIGSILKLIIQSIYSILPIFIIFYLFQIYNDTTEHLYYPNFPNSHKESTLESMNDIGVEFYDLADYRSTGTGWQNQERVLFLVPLRDASAHLPMFFGHMKNLTYPHNLIDLAFLISDTSDSTIPDLKRHLKEIQADSDISKRFGRIDIYEKNFGQIVGQSFSDRHGFAAQGPRRKLMAIARNWLLTTALRPDHSWVYWRDADVETVPATIIEDLMHHDKDVIVPNIWRPLPDWLGYEQAYDLNSWQESEGGIELADNLDEDAVIVEGYPEYATWRPHLAYLRDPYGDPEVEIELDGIGGVSILAKANVFKEGAMFPAFSFKKHAETEAFGKLCKTMGYNVIGLPHYVIWHIYEPSSDDLKHMEWLANEELRQLEHEKNKHVYDKAWELAFEDVTEQWTEEKFNVFKNTDLTKLGIGSVDWADVDEYLAEVDDDELLYSPDNVNDENFLINLDNTNKEFEEQVLERLNKGPVRFGFSKNEQKFDNYFKMDGAKKKKQMKFKKFEISKEEEELRSKIQALEEQTEDNVFHDFYDPDAGKVVEDVNDKHRTSKTKSGETDELIDKLTDDNTINKDKQLFNDLESKKMDKDGEEGEVEFKKQKLIEKKIKKATKGPDGSKKTVEQVATKTLYEVDDAGVTINTVYEWGTVTQTPEVELKDDDQYIGPAGKTAEQIKAKKLKEAKAAVAKFEEQGNDEQEVIADVKEVKKAKSEEKVELKEPEVKQPEEKKVEAEPPRDEQPVVKKAVNDKHAIPTEEEIKEQAAQV